jgi:hypothetical protein
VKYSFLHKSHRPQRIAADPKWTDLAFVIAGIRRRRFYCDRVGVLESALYLPVQFELPGDEPAVLRVRLVREAVGALPNDPTGYDERTLLPSADGFARVRFLYRGEAQRRRYYWQAQVIGNATVTASGTHYAQFWRR